MRELDDIHGNTVQRFLFSVSCASNLRKTTNKIWGDTEPAGYVQVGILFLESLDSDILCRRTRGYSHEPEKLLFSFHCTLSLWFP